MYKQIFGIFYEILIFFLLNNMLLVMFYSFLLNALFSQRHDVCFHNSDFTMVWLDYQLEKHYPSLTNQMMTSHTTEDLNCLWRSNIIKV